MIDTLALLVVVATASAVGWAWGYVTGRRTRREEP